MTTASRTANTARVSHRDLTPLEQGGPFARAGFRYQDHVAAAKCLQMMVALGANEVWCEAEDDIVLVWSGQAVETFEFVQVKSDDLGQAWTIAELCRRPPAKVGKPAGKSIVEKSLAHDRGQEPCTFRVVTTWRPHEDLELLTLALDHHVRLARGAELEVLSSEIERKVGTCTSENGNGVAFWVRQAVWEHCASSKDVEAANLLLLERLLAAEDAILAPDQRVALYERLVTKIQDASEANGVLNPAAKRLVRAELRTWMFAEAAQILRPPRPGTTTNLVRKLTDAGSDATTIDAAIEQRRRYLAARRESKYLSVDEHDEVEGAIGARLHLLRVRLDAREFDDDGRQFLSRCLLDLAQLRQSSPPVYPPEAYIFGCMYETMNRCLHRLTKSST